MAISVHPKSPWGKTTRYNRVEYRCDYVDSITGRIINETLYFASDPDATVLAAVVEDRRIVVKKRLVDDEEEANGENLVSGSGIAMTFLYTDMYKMRKAIKKLYKQEAGLRMEWAARWLDQNCTDAQLQTAFGYATLQEAVDLRVKLKKKIEKLTAWELERDQKNAAEAAANVEASEG